MKQTFTSKLKAICLLAICFGVVSTSKAQVAQLLADIATLNSSASSSPASGPAVNSAPIKFAKVGSKIVFRASDGTTLADTAWHHGLEVFVYDASKPVTANGGKSGTPWNTTTNPMCIDLNPNTKNLTTGATTAIGSSNPQEFVAYGGKVYFAASKLNNGTGTNAELWVLDLNQPIQDSAAVYSGANPGMYGVGTNPMMVDLWTGTAKQSNPNGLYPYNGSLYFSAAIDSTVEGGAKGIELWKFDTASAVSSNNGVTSFTSSTNPRFINIGTDVTGGASFNGFGALSNTTMPVGCNGKLYFAGAANVNTGAELWVLDPTASISVGTNPAVVADVNPRFGTSTAGVSSGSNPSYLTDVNGVLFYRSAGGDTAGFANQGFELWKYNPSASVQDSAAAFGGVAGRYGIGTNPGMVKDINQAATGNGFTATSITAIAAPVTGGQDVPYRFPQINGVVYFGARDSFAGTPSTGNELWRSDGTEAGTYRVKDLCYNNRAGTIPNLIYARAGKLYFMGFQGNNTGAKWCWMQYTPGDTSATMTLDGTTNPAVISNTGSGVSSAFLSTVQDINGLIYASFANNGGATTDLNVYDPNKAITATITTASSSNPKLLNTNANSGGWNPKYITDLGNGNIAFSGSLPPSGTVGGTELIGMNIYNAVTASAGSNGSISNSGVTTVNYGYNQTYTITAASGYCPDSLIVDGVKVAPATTYTFTNVTAAHTIVVNFIATVTPSVSISTATTTVCSGSNTTFTAIATNGGSNPTYQWKKNGVDAGTGSSIVFLSNTLSNNDVITCVLTANNPCQTSATATSNSIQVKVNASPAVLPINTGTVNITTASLCTLGSTVRYYDNTPYGTWSSSNPAVASVSSTGSGGNVTANTNGTATITYSLTATNGCVSTSTLAVTVAAITTNAISGTNSICIGATTALSCTAPAGTTGVWSSSNNLGTINASGVYTGANAGNYGQAKYTVTNASGCSASSVYTITVNPTPGVPTISYAPGTPSPQGAGGFCTNKTFTVVGTPTGGVWSKTGVINVTTPGGVVTTGSVAGAGTLKYTYTSAAGCSNSRTLVGNVVACAARGVSISNEQLTMSNEFSMYPNPAKGFINLNVETLVGKGSIVVTDLYGKAVKTQSLSMGTNTVNTSNLSKGFYLVSVITAEGKTTKKLIVE